MQHSVVTATPQHKLLQTIVDRIPITLTIIDARGRILWINREWQRALGWPLKEARRLDTFPKRYTQHRVTVR